MTEVSREELSAINNKLNNRISALERKVNLLPDPFSPLSMLQVRKGGTGAARIRRIPLFSDLTTGISTSDTEGNFSDIQHYRLEDAVTDYVYYTPVILPADFISGGVPSLHYLYSNDVTTGDVTWVISVRSIVGGSAVANSVLGDTTSITVGGTADSLTERSVDFTTTPKQNTTLAAYIRRTGGAGSDTSTGIASVWSAWIEYLAFI